MSLLKKANAFLIQVDSTRKNFVPSRYNGTLGKPIFAEDVLLHNRFKLDAESKETHPDFDKVKIKDYIIVYCNSLVPHSPNQIKFIFTVVSKLGNQIVLRIHTKLNRGYSLEHIQSLIGEGKLSNKMNKCGVKGFKIGQVDFEDLELLINFDPIVRSYHSTSWKT